MIDEEVLDIIADEIINEHLPYDIIPIIYVPCPDSGPLSIRVVGLHLVDTNNLLEFENRKASNLSIKKDFITDIGYENYHVSLCSYEIWDLFHLIKSDKMDEDLLYLVYMTEIHHNLSFDWLTNKALHFLISKSIFHRELATPNSLHQHSNQLGQLLKQQFNRIMRLTCFLNTKEYIWEQEEIDLFAAQIDIQFEQNNAEYSLLLARQNLLKTIQISDLQEIVSDCAIELIDKKVMSLRLSII